MASQVKAYDRAQNNYALGVVDSNAANIFRLAKEVGAEVVADIKVVPTDIFGRVLTQATVAFGEAAAAKVEDCGNITTVALFSNVTYKVEAEGFAPVEGSIESVRGNQLIHVTLFPQAAVAEQPTGPSGSEAIPRSIDTKVEEQIPQPEVAGESAE